MATLTSIIERVRTIVTDLPSALDAHIVEDINRAQEDCEEYWEEWPFLDSVLQVTTVQYQFGQAMNGSSIPQTVRDRWLRWRTSDPPWYVYDGIVRPVEMEWSVASHTPDSTTTGPASYGDIAEVYTKGGTLSEIAGPPTRISIVDDADVTDPVAYGRAPSVFYIDPPCDLGPSATPGVYELNIPIQLRQPTLVSSTQESNWWTINAPRILENAAAANFLRDNQDVRYLEYQQRAETELFQLKNQWKRRMARRTRGTLPVRTGVYGNRHSGRLP